MRPVPSNVASARVDSYVESAEYILERGLYIVPVGEARVEVRIIYVIPDEPSLAGESTYVRHIEREWG
jgi:hypothetical protein